MLFNNKLPFAACRTIIDKHAQEIYKYCHYSTYYMTQIVPLLKKRNTNPSIRMVSYQLATSIAASVFPENASVIPLIRFPAGSEEKLRSNGGSPRLYGVNQQESCKDPDQWQERH